MSSKYKSTLLLFFLPVLCLAALLHACGPGLVTPDSFKKARYFLYVIGSDTSFSSTRIFGFSVDTETGYVSVANRFPGTVIGALITGTSLLMDPSGQYAYLVTNSSMNGTPGIHSGRVNSRTGAISDGSGFPLGPNDINGLGGMDSSGKNIIFSRSSGNIEVYGLDASTGSLFFKNSQMLSIETLVGVDKAFPFFHTVAFSTTLKTYSLDVDSGSFFQTWATSIAPASILSSVFDYANGVHISFSNGASQVIRSGFTAASGEVALGSSVDLPTSFNSNTMHVNNLTKRLFIASRNSISDNVRVYKINDDHSLEFLTTNTVNGTIVAMTTDTSGRFLFASCQGSTASLKSYAVDSASGRMSVAAISDFSLDGMISNSVGGLYFRSYSFDPNEE